MYFDDEKENIEDLQIQDDAISWDTIIDTDEDGIVSIKDNKTTAPTSEEVPVEVFSNEESIPDISSIDLGDDLSVVQDEDETLDEAELAKILNADDTEVEQQLEFNDTENVDTNLQEEISHDDIGVQEAEDDIVPRKETVENKKSVSPVLIAALVALIVLAGSYFAFTMFSNKEDDDVPLVNTDTLQQNTENTMQNAEDIQQADSIVTDADTAIPVVNEEEVDTLKADEQTKEEKKQIVNVIPTGRINPFLPLYKYDPKSGSPTVINTIDYSNISLPKAPMQYGKQELSGNIDKLMSVSVSGIMYDAQKPSAIITYNNDDYFVLIGDKLDKFKVVGIGPDSVKIAYEKNIYTAKVGESFNIKNFYGNIKYNDGGRQYYSSEDEYYTLNGIVPDNRDKSSSSGNGNQGDFGRGRYTSDKDIMIKNK